MWFLYFDFTFLYRNNQFTEFLLENLEIEEFIRSFTEKRKVKDLY